MATSFDCQVEGTDLLHDLIDLLTDDRVVDAVVRDTGAKLSVLAGGRTPIGDPKMDPHPGLAQRSWTEPTATGDNQFSFTNNQDYTSWLEFGLYPDKWVRPGGRLVQQSDGVYSRQAPTGIVRSLFDDDAIIRVLAGGARIMLRDQLGALLGRA